MDNALPLLAQQYRLVGTTQSSTMLFSVAGTSAEAITISTGVETDELVGKAYCSTPQGWLLVRDRRDTIDTYLLDHFTRQRIQLPPLDGVAPDLLVSCHVRLSNKNPTAPGCIVLVVEPDDTVMWYYRIGNSDCSSWIRYEYDIGTQGNEEYGFEKKIIYSIASCGGKFYFNPCHTANIGVLEFLPTPVFSTITALGPTAATNIEDLTLNFLVESGDAELYLVGLLYCYEWKEADVYKMDFSTHQWLPVDDLNGNAFFVSCNFGASCIAAEEYGIQKNCVYSVINHMADKCLKMFVIEQDGWSTADLRNMEETYLFTPHNIDIEEVIKSDLQSERIVSWVLPTALNKC